ncbi:MAG: putative lipid II flippase FtsW [Actinomycetota bacterium]|nr:putative lipid II flippase FtsW [Actinomycetota bacterium]
MAGAAAGAAGGRVAKDRYGRMTGLERSRATARADAPPLEHRMLLTATLCLLAFGAVMVYSASSPRDLVVGQGTGMSYLIRYLLYGLLGLAAMRVLARRGMALLDRRMVTLLLGGSFALLLLVLVPGIGVKILNARRWFAAGPIQFQPSELMKLAIVLYVAGFLADHPKRIKSFRQAIVPVMLVAGPACMLIVVEPDLGTTLVVAFAVGGLLVASGVPMRYLAIVAGIAALAILLLVLAQPYQRLRLTAFLHPWGSAAGYQSVQGQIAIGSGGLFGAGIGQGVQKAFYLPEAQTDFVLAVIGEELGVLGIFGLICLYAMIAWSGLRIARRATTRYAKLLASGLTTLILCQAILNIFVVLGLAPLTGVPLPFISYAPTNMCIVLASVGLLLNISSPPGRRLKVVGDASRDSRDARDRRRRARGA